MCPQLQKGVCVGLYICEFSDVNPIDINPIIQLCNWGSLALAVTSTPQKGEQMQTTKAEACITLIGLSIMMTPSDNMYSIIIHDKEGIPITIMELAGPLLIVFV